MVGVGGRVQGGGSRVCEPFPIRANHGNGLDLHHHSGECQTGQGDKGDSGPGALWRAIVGQHVLGNVRQEGMFVHVTIGRIERHQLDDIGQSRTESLQDRVDVADYHSGLGSAVIGV